MEELQWAVYQQEKPYPWRRYFARNLDFLIYQAFVCAVLEFGLHINCRKSIVLVSLHSFILVTLLALVLEPALLALFGTTIGKWILGIHVSSKDGSHLPYKKAFVRTWLVLLYGMGLRIPIYDLVRNWKSYTCCRKGEKLEWEHESQMTLEDRKARRIIVLIVVSLMMYGILDFTTKMEQMPRYRGDITPEEFCENYNQFTKYYAYGDKYLINKDGTPKLKLNSSVIMSNAEDMGPYTLADMPAFRFNEKDGIMKGMSFSQEINGSDEAIPNYQENMILCIMAFVRAQNGYTPFSEDLDEMIAEIETWPFEYFKYSIYGVTITCKIRYYGYTAGDECVLYPNGEGKTEYSVSFTMTKE